VKTERDFYDIITLLNAVNARIVTLKAKRGRKTM
jgi:hypothetical protein